MFFKCLEESSAHGIPHLVRKSKRRVKFTWFLIISVALSIFLFHSSTLVKKYLDYDTNISIEFNGADFVYPDVWICPTFGHFSIMMMNERLRQNDSHYDKLLSLTAHNGMKYIEIMLKRPLKHFSHKELDKILHDRKKIDIISHPEIFTRKAYFGQHHACYVLNHSYLMSQFYRNKYFLFYTDRYWISHKNESDDYSQNRSHLIKGTSKFTSSTSHQIFFTPPRQYPTFKSFSVRLQGGKRNTIALSMDYYKNVNRKNSPCTENPENFTLYDISQISTNQSSYQYTPENCAYEVFQWEIFNKNSCLYGYYPITQQQSQQANEQLCSINVRNATYHEDLYFNEDYKHCWRYKSCNFPVYTAQVEEESFSDGQPNYNINLACKKYPKYYCHIKEKYANGELKLERLKKMFTKFKILIQSPKSTLYKESFSYELKSLLSDIGGILGFYMGISFVTIFEVFAYGMEKGNIRRN